MADESAMQGVAAGGTQIKTYRVRRPQTGIIPIASDRFEATEFAEQRRGLHGLVLNARDAVLGSTMSNARLAHERLSKKVALAVFSSDALSSTAYATQEIILVLVAAGAGAMRFTLPLAIAIAVLLAIVVVSYRQTVRAYPNGGGAYIVAHENLGTAAGLIAAASLLVDYVLTVSVSISASVEAITSAAPSVAAFAVPLSCAMVVLIAIGNLRGLKESGTIFAIPTYGFVILLSLTITVGLMRTLFGASPDVFAAAPPAHPLQNVTESVGLFLILRAFSSGCTALTGVEAISNGVSAFKQPEAKNASQTLLAMGLILGTLFLGTTLLARHYGIVYEKGDSETVMSQVGAVAFGGKNILYYALQAFTAGILFLAANTAFADFPRLAAILARDGYMPRIFHQRGNRLVFSYGITTLSVAAIGILVIFGASTSRIIPLYALGVFLSFTLSQAGMVIKWRRDRGAGWKRSAIINGGGAIATAIVFVVVAMSKFTEGAWAVVIIVPIVASTCWRIGHFYRRVQRELHVPADRVFDLTPHGPSRTPIFVPVEDVNLATLVTIGAACDRSRSVTAVHVRYDTESEDRLIARWPEQFPDIPLAVIDSPYRTVAEPMAWYLRDRLRELSSATVMIPSVQVGRWYQRPLVNQSMRRLRGLLKHRRGIEFVEQPFPIA
jgi:amino acid transporter